MVRVYNISGEKMIRSKLSEWSIAVLLISLLVALPVSAQTTAELQRDFVQLRFGMFIHFGIRTFTGARWATPNENVQKFDPVHLDCNQWASAAAAAGMKFAILTTKHHDGFCLWPSKYSKNSVASSPWENGNGDVLRDFVDAFRAHGIYPCFYYSIWDNTMGIGNGPITAKDMKVIEGQITELLTEYGPIKMLFIDGWSWKMGHVAVPYATIRALVKKLQPGCLLVDNTHLHCLYENDMVFYEAGKVLPSDNTVPSIQSELINKESGNGWFWDPRVPAAPLLSVKKIVRELTYCEHRWCDFVLNCPPNREGLLDSNIVARLKEVGNVWSPDSTRPPLPKQAPFIDYPVMPVSASATSGDAAYAIDGKNDRYFYSVWKSSASLPQSLTIDLGKVYPDVSILNYVPQYDTVETPMKTGSIEAYSLYASVDGKEFTEVAHGIWKGTSDMKVVSFEPVKARYIRLTALKAVDNYAAATEIEIGTASPNLEVRP